MIWFWGESRLPDIPGFFKEFGKTGAVVAAVDLIKGLGRMVGLKIIDVPGATGYVDTNYLGKGQSAVAALDEYDFVWVHVEAPDEAGHESDIEKKIRAIEDCDGKVLGHDSGRRQEARARRSHSAYAGPPDAHRDRLALVREGAVPAVRFDET